MSRVIYLLQIVAFLDLLAVGLIIPLVPNHVRQMGGNHIYVGLLGSIYAGFQLASGPLIGSLSDIKGRKSILMITLLFCSVAYTLIGLTTSIVVILIIRAFLGLFKQTQILTKALVPDYEKNEKKQSIIYGKMAAISGAGITLGPLIGGHIAEDNPKDGFTFIAIIVGICFVINSGLVYFLPNTRKMLEKEKSAPAEMGTNNILQNIGSSIKQSVLELYNVQWSEYWEIFLLKALVGFAMSLHYSNYSLFLKTQYDLTPKYVGYVISFQGVVGSVSSYFMGYINKLYNKDEDYSQRNFHVFLVLSTSLAGFLLSFNVNIYVFWLIPLAIGNAVGRLVTLDMILKRSHGEHRGMLIGASNSVRSMAGVVAPMTAGFIGQYLGVKFVVYVSLFSTLVGTFLSYRIRNTRKKLSKQKEN